MSGCALPPGSKGILVKDDIGLLKNISVLISESLELESLKNLKIDVSEISDWINFEFEIDKNYHDFSEKYELVLEFKYRTKKIELIWCNEAR